MLNSTVVPFASKNVLAEPKAAITGDVPTIFTISYKLATQLNSINFMDLHNSPTLLLGGKRKVQANLKRHSIIKVYHPILYARENYKKYCTLYGAHTKQIIYVGMNPGFAGMCQTGVPFGAKSMVQSWLQISEQLDDPPPPYPNQPARNVVGFRYHLNERSGTRMWGFFKSQYATPENFFKHSFVYNFFPVAFDCRTPSTGIANYTLEDLLKDYSTNAEVLLAIGLAQHAFSEILECSKAKYVVCFGKLAYKYLKHLESEDVLVIQCDHPSPRVHKSDESWNAKFLETLAINRVPL